MGNSIRNILVLVIGLTVFGLLGGCQKDLSSPNPNEPPTTTLYNNPGEGDTLYALVELAWDGGDPDGFIQGYEYRYTTYYTTKPGSVATDWVETDITTHQIAFNSSDTYNRQVFQVRAIDNTGQVDPTPAEKTFYTTQTIPPEIDILAPAAGEEMFAIDQTTDWWPGIRLSYTGSDEDGEILEYGYSVDGGEWTWTADTTLYITPDQLSTPLDGEHTIQVNARDNTYIENPDPPSVTFNLVEPSFEKDILIIDETDESQFPSSASVPDDSVDNFYADLFGDVDTWDYVYYSQRTLPNLPARSELGQYNMVIWHADNKPSTSPHALAEHVDYIKDYMNVGGDFVMSGWRILKSFAWDRDFPASFADSTFVNEYLHIARVDETPFWPGDFIGAEGQKGFTDVTVDSTKLSAFPYDGKLSEINVIKQRAGFTDILYRYRNSEDSNLLQYRGSTCGLMYTGTVFDAVILGFPMYFIKKEDAKIMADEILRTLQYK